MRVHIVQPDIRWHDKAFNHEHVRLLLDPVDVGVGDLVVLPEMFDTGFSFDIEATNDKGGGGEGGERPSTLQFLLDLADDTGAMVMGGRTFAPCHAGACSARNLMSIVAPGQRLLAEYAKQRLFAPAGEDKRFQAGLETILFDWNGLRVQVAICYDLRFPEVFRAGLAAGAGAIALGACWPVVRQHHWRSLLMARAIENQCFVFASNRVGNDPAKGDGSPGLAYAGGSIVLGPKGEVLAEANAQGMPEVLSIAIDATAMETWRAQFPAWRGA